MTKEKGPKPTVPEVLPLIHRYYRKHTSGGLFHVVLDDGNFEKDSFIESTLKEAEDPASVKGEHTAEDNALAAEIARLMLRMTYTQRKKLYYRAGDYEPMTTEERYGPPEVRYASAPVPGVAASLLFPEMKSGENWVMVNQNGVRKKMRID